MVVKNHHGFWVAGLGEGGEQGRWFWEGVDRGQTPFIIKGGVWAEGYWACTGYWVIKGIGFIILG